MNNELIINFTPTGMVPMKADNPNVPIQIDEIIDSVHEAYEKGITLAHLHLRNKESGLPDYRPEGYGRLLDGVKKYCEDLVCCLSLSGRNYSEFEKRSAAIELKPDMASLTLSSLNFKNQASINSPETIIRLLEKMQEHGVKPELEIFDLGMKNFFLYLVKKKMLEPPYYVNFIFGNIFSMQPEFSDFAAITSNLPKDTYYSFGGLGRFQFKTHLHAIASGAGVRIGLEDNLFMDKKKSIMASNISLLDRVHRVAQLYERSIMKPETFGNLGFYNNN